jgi:4-hydroxybenzoate polyprenyltransferase
MTRDAASRRRWRDAPLALAMLAPSLVVLGAFVLYPLARAFWLGHQRCDPTGANCQSNGWDQYIDVFRSKEFQQAFGVTFRFALLTVPVGLALGIGLAVLADKQLRGMGFFRTVFSSTVATSVAVASLMWFFLLNPSVGVLADWIGGVAKNPGLLQDEGTALWAVAVSSIWANLGFTFIVVTAGLQSIPARLGVPRSLRLAKWFHLVTMLLLSALPLVVPQLGWIYWIAYAVIAALLVWEHSLVRPDDLSRVNQAFFSANAAIGLILLAAITTDLWW